MTAADFIAAFRGPCEESAGGHDSLIARLREQLQGLPGEQQFQILFPIAVKNPYVGEFPVLDAARLLRELNPDSPLSCEEAVSALLPEWSASLEEVPFYLAKRFGPSRVYEAVASLGAGLTDKSQRSSLDTVAYWVHVYEGTWPVNQ